MLGEERWTRKKHEKVQVRVTIKALTSSPTFRGLRDRLGKHVPGVRPNAKKAGAFVSSVVSSRDVHEIPKLEYDL